jgi:hypothetical protein
MKTVKNYDNFSQEYRLNEGLLGKAWGTIFNFFKKKFGTSAWLYYALFLKKAGKLPSKKVEIIVPSSYPLEDGEIPTPEELKLELTAESFKDTKISISHNINEAIVDLRSNNPNIINFDVKELVEEIIDIYNMNRQRVEKGESRTKNDALFIWGAPGIGKTEILNQVAEKLGCLVQEWHLAQLEPTDFRGVPKIENVLGSGKSEDERTVTKLPAIFPTDDGDNGRGGIMFFDELNRAPKMVLSAALSLCLGGKMGLYELPPMWIVVAAGNRPDDLGGAIATEIEPALANRFAHVNYAPTLESWIDWAMTKKIINPDLIAFLKFNKGYFHKLDPEEGTRPWPSPRTWEMSSKKDFFKRGDNWKNKLSNEEIQKIYTRLVGGEAAIAFTEYLKLKEFYNEKDVADVYKKGKGAKKPPTRLDQARAAAASIAFFKKGEELTVQELTNILEWALDLPDVESKTSMISFLKMVHPEIKEKEPWKKIYWDAVKQWHIGLKEIS